MKLSNETLSILKNFSSIKDGILFKEGDTLTTVSDQRNILASAKIKENFPKSFGIFNLNDFLSVISLYKDDCSFEFDDKTVIIKGMNGRSSIKYRITDPSMIFDDKNLEVIDKNKRPKLEAFVNFELSQNDFNWIIKTASVLKSPNIAIKSDGVEVSLVCFDSSNDSANVHSMKLENVNNDGRKFNFVFKTINLKILPGNYFVEVSENGISKFSDNEKEIYYWITLESCSTYN